MIPDKQPVYVRGTKASKFFGLPVEKREDPIEGWRTWKLHQAADGRWYIRSVTANRPWNSPVMTTNVDQNGRLAKVALNNPKRHSSGRGDYGVYSYRNIQGLKIYHGFREIVGRIENYGHVVEHEFGYRAQKCVVRTLFILPYLPGPQVKLKEDLEEIYQCPVFRLYGENPNKLMREILKHDLEVKRNG